MQDTSRSTVDNIFNQASFSKAVWELTTKIMDMFEEGELKNQCLSTKSLVTKPEFKQQYLSPIQCLPDDFKIEILQDAIEGELSLQQIKEKASDYRSQKSIERAFCR